MWSNIADMQEEQSKSKVILLWDQLKQQLKKSEEDEMARLIGREMIEKVEDLREQYCNLLDIMNDIEDQEQVSTPLSSFVYDQRNGDFINKEISFLIDNLRKKAVDSGLTEDSLMPLKDSRDKQIYDFLNTSMQRPQSAMSQSTRPGSALANKQTEMSMRSSFYSSSAQGENSGEKKIVDTFKLSNVLELTQQEQQILSQIKTIMQEQCERLTQDIDEIQQQMMMSSSAKSRIERPPTSKELKDFSQKLQDEYLRSDSVAKLSSSTPKRKNSLPRMIAHGLGTTNPIPSTTQISFKKAAINFQPPTDQLSSNLTQTSNTLSQMKSLIPKKGPIKLTKASIKGIDASSSEQQQQTNVSISKLQKQSTLMSNTQTSNNEQCDKKNVISWSKIKNVCKNTTTAPSQERQQLKSREGSLNKPKSYIKIKKSIDTSSKKQEFYGLDIEFLKELDLGDMIEEMQLQQPQQQQPDNEKMNKILSDLQEEFGQEKTAARKLRGICKEYRPSLKDEHRKDEQ